MGEQDLRKGQFSVNLASVDMLELVDYFGQTSGKKGVKNAVSYSWSRCAEINAPSLDISRWVCECEVVQTVATGESDTFFCRVKHLEVAQEIEIDDFGIDLTGLDPVVYSGKYHSLNKCLGNIGDFYCKPEDAGKVQSSPKAQRLS